MITVDSGFVRPGLAAVFILPAGREATIIETATASSVGAVLNALRTARLSPVDVKYIIVTHAHLDHCGGAGAYLEHCTGATVVAHRRAAGHLANPARLLRGSRKVYGEEHFDALFGGVVPVPRERILTPGDNEELEFGGRILRFLHTRGHANHHLCVYDSDSNGVFTGDTFGIAYPLLQNGRHPFIYPTSSPTDFDPDQARQSIERIRATGAGTAYLTHFGSFHHLAEGEESLRRGLQAMEETLNAAAESELVGGSDLDGERLQDFCRDRLTPYFEGELKRCELAPDDEQRRMIDTDIHFSAMGIAQVAERRRARVARSESH